MNLKIPLNDLSLVESLIYHTPQRIQPTEGPIDRPTHLPTDPPTDRPKSRLADRIVINSDISNNT